MSAVRVYDANTPVAPAWVGERGYMGLRLVAGRDHIAEAVTEMLGWDDPIAVDIETCGISPQLRRQVKVVTLASRNMVIAIDPRDPVQAAEVRRALGTRHELIMHNSPFDAPILVGQGLAEPSMVRRVYDTLVLARLGMEKNSRRDLSSLARNLLGVETGDIVELFKAAGFTNKAEGFLHMDIDTPLFLTSAMMDASLTWALKPTLVDTAVKYLTDTPYGHLGLNRDGALNEIERQQTVNRVMLGTTIRGFLIDEDVYHRYLSDTALTLETAENKLRAADIRPGVGADLVKRLSEAGQLPFGWPKTATGKLSSAKDDLERIRANPLADAHLSYKEISKNLSDYMNKLTDFADGDGRVHPEVKVLGADATGRMSASNPPVQQFPDDARKLIVADDPGGWVSIDYSAVEPMVAAYTSGEMWLAREVVNGADIYVPVGRAGGLIPESVPDSQAGSHAGRNAAKVVLLGLLYGKGNKLLASELGVSYDAAQAIKTSILSGMPAIANWMECLSQAAGRYGRTITAAGRVISIPRNFERGGFKDYIAQNYYHQGSAYDTLADAIVELDRRGLGDEIRLAVHDELVVTAAAAPDVANVMRYAATSLGRFLTAAGLSDRASVLQFPTDSHALPERWLKV